MNLGHMSDTSQQFLSQLEALENRASRLNILGAVFGIAFIVLVFTVLY
jgi:hypothetical protein